MGWGMKTRKNQKQHQNSKRKFKEEKKFNCVFVSSQSLQEMTDDYWKNNNDYKNNILENDDDVADDNPIKVIVILEWQLRQKQQFLKKQHFWYDDPRKKWTIFDLK